MTKKVIPTLNGLLKTSGWSAMAAALAMMAIPTELFAQDPSRGGWRGSQSSAQTQRGSGGRWQRGSQGSTQVQSIGGGRGRGGATAQTQRQRQPQTQKSNRLDSGERSSQSQVQQSQRQSHQLQNQQGGNRTTTIQQRGNRRAGNVERRSERQAGAIRSQGQYSARSNNRGDRSRDWRRNGPYSNPDRNRSYRDSARGNQRRNVNDSWRSGKRYSYNENHRNWDRSWRNNSRYDWRGYRSHNHGIFRSGKYYSPYNGYGYSRLAAGFFLESLFYSSRYWIDDPGYYRLPAAYGPYRWIRYYDDALLVDRYSGEVIDVIYDFFW